MKKPIIYLFFILVLCSFAYGKVTVTTSTPYTIGYIIEGTTQEFIRSNTDFTFNFFVRNITDGVMIDDSKTNCSFYMANSTGQLLVYVPSVTYNILDYWSININGSNFTNEGYYPYGVKCNSSNLGGAIVGYFYSYTDRIPTDYKGQDGSIIALTLFLLLVNGILFYLSFKKRFKDELVDFIVRRCLLIISIFLLMWNTTIIATMVSNSNLGVTKELFMYMEIFGYVGYIGIIILFFTSLLQFMKAWKTKKQRKSDGEHYEQ